MHAPGRLPFSIPLKRFQPRSFLVAYVHGSLANTNPERTFLVTSHML